jgi:apolipoprotein N-acyltransferase
MFDDANLSFLAWFAFVPHFLFLEANQRNFWKSILASYLGTLVYVFIAAGWLFYFPRSASEIASMIMIETVSIFGAFIPFCWLQRKWGFDKALWTFPAIWVVWEWMYVPLEFTMGTHILAYSQSSNLWLVQFIDITGAWGLSGWVIVVNILAFNLYKQWKLEGLTIKLAKRSALYASGAIGLPLLYAGASFLFYGNGKNGESILVSLVPTHYGADVLSNADYHAAMAEETLHRTDSIAFAQLDAGRKSDLYVWPETGIAFDMMEGNLNDLLFEATSDWKGALLTGGKGLSNEQQPYVAGILIDPKRQAPVYHYKTVLTPGQEAIPYHHWLAKLPFFPIPERNYYKKGDASMPLPIHTNSGKTVLLGVSLCFEQWYPSHWVDLARNGAVFYAHLAGEGWYGNFGFQPFMANVTRLRAIENRRPVARCANVGKTLFIDRMGRYSPVQSDALAPIQKHLYASDVITIYNAFPNWLPIACLLGLLYMALASYKTSDKRFIHALKTTSL